jgi:mRNA interferase RelE/StbE
VSALQEFHALDRQVQRRISTKISELSENPFPAGVKKFHGEANHWRLRIGDYRVIYRVEKHRVVIVVVPIEHRREVYR